MPQKYVPVDGIATFVHHVGATTLPGRPPRLAQGETVVCLHCANGSGAMFVELSAKLAAVHSPLAFDRPGHAHSGGLDALPSIAQQSEFTRAFCAALGIGSCVLLGTGSGGCVALETAIRAPLLVRALVLVASSACNTIPQAAVDQLQLVSEGKARRDFDRNVYSSAASPDVLRRGFMEDLKTDPRVVHGNALALRGWTRESELAQVTCPTLIVAGEHDATSIAHGEILARGIRGARQMVIEKCGQRVALEQPALLADAVAAFLTELPS